jgi:hypothetical protein
VFKVSISSGDTTTGELADGKSIRFSNVSENAKNRIIEIHGTVGAAKSFDIKGRAILIMVNKSGYYADAFPTLSMESSAVKGNAVLNVECRSLRKIECLLTR